jgi:hypothetical protein
VNEEEKQFRRKYDVYEGDPRTITELINQIFADDDIDPHQDSSRSLIKRARMTYELNTYDRPEAKVGKPYNVDDITADRQRYEIALAQLLRSASFRRIYQSKLKRLLAMSRSRIEFNNKGMNCGGAVRIGAFRENIVGIELYFDFNSKIEILTTRGFVEALPERVVAHELLETLQTIACSELANLSQVDAGMLAMDTVLQVNKIMRELVKAGVLNSREGASRIRYYR